MPEPQQNDGTESEPQAAADGGTPTEDVSGLKRSLTAEREARREADKAGKKQAKAIEDLNTTIREMKEATQASDAGVDNQELQDLVLERTATMREDFETRIKAGEEVQGKNRTELADLQGRYKHAVIGSDLHRVLASLDVQPFKTAVADLVEAGMTVFGFEEEYGDIPVGRDPKGALLMSSDGDSPMSIKEWGIRQAKERPHCFPGKSGAGSRGSDFTRGGSGGDTSGYTPTEKIKAGLEERVGAA